MRKIYEDSESLSKESSFAVDFKGKRKVNLAKLPRQYHLDYAMISSEHELEGFLELKNRTNSKKAYDTYMISLSKLLKAKEYKDKLGVDTILAVRWNDADGCINLSSLDDYQVRLGGRFDRGDWQDIEPVVHFDIAKFEDI